MERRMVTLSHHNRKGGVRARKLHSPTSYESADCPSAHPQLVGLCRVLNPMFPGSAHCLSGPASPKAAVRIGCTAVLLRDTADFINWQNGECRFGRNLALAAALLLHYIDHPTMGCAAVTSPNLVGVIGTTFHWSTYRLWKRISACTVVGNYPPASGQGESHIMVVLCYWTNSSPIFA